MIVLGSDALLVRLDPAHGGEILDLVDLRTGRQLLGRPPFSSTEPLGGDLEEPTWTAAYRGGWQVVLPNAGNACEVDGVHHGFHGRASNDPWTVVDESAAAAELAWEGHGLSVTRRLAVVAGVLEVKVEATATSDDVPLVAVEHLSVGLELLEPEVELELPGGLAYELSEADGPPERPARARPWPESLLLDGSTERCDRWRLDEPRSRYMVVTDVPEGRAHVRNALTGQGLELRWDTDWLRHVWIWHEARTYPGPWRHQAEILAIEPASVPHGLGLAEALRRGQTKVLRRGESVGYGLTVRPTGPSG